MAQPIASTIVPGFHSVRARLAKDPQAFATVLLSTSRKDRRSRDLTLLLQSHGVPTRLCDREELDAVAAGQKHQGVVGILHKPDTAAPDLPSLLAAVGEQAMILALDRVQDPRNLGACIRTAECAGAVAVILPQNHACPINATVRKAASGAVELIPVLQVGNLVTALTKCKEAGFWIYGADECGDTPLDECRFMPRSVIVMGAEGSGLRRLVRQSCDYCVRIPMQGRIANLNVAVATGVVLFQTIRSLDVRF